MEEVSRALDAALDGVGVLHVGERTVGYTNDRWVVATDRGTLLVKVLRLPSPHPVHVAGQRRAQRLLVELGFPTPEMLYLGESSAFDDRLMSVQRFVPAVAADEGDDAVMNALDERVRHEFFVNFGRAVGWLHSIDLPCFGGWLDEQGVDRGSWVELVFPRAALRDLHDRPEVGLSRSDVRTVERRIVAGLDGLPEIRPRLVHRDLHAGNILFAEGRFAGLVDLDIVREWDGPWDFATRIDGACDYWKCRTPFMAGYRDTAGELPADFDFRRWLYTGIDTVRSISEFLAGNSGYANQPARLREWLTTPPPE
ncbi:phosphotransferase family protein [Actinopolymorpha pittospori]